MNILNKKARRIFVAIFMVFLITIVCMGIFLSVNKTKTRALADTNDGLQTNEVLSYTDVFESYYNQAVKEVNDEGVIMPFSFDEFCESYYSYEYDITTFSNFFVDFTIEYVQDYPNAGISTYDSSSSQTADYILNSLTDYAITPASEFRCIPNYSGYEGQHFNYSLLIKGDLINETKTTWSTGHTAMIVDTNHASVYGSYVQTIEAVGCGVSYGILDDNRMVRYGINIMRVDGASESQRNNAIYFIRKQLGVKFSLVPTRLNKSINSTEWYCSELCYAAYKYAGIDIGVVKSTSGNDIYLKLGCIPADIYESYRTFEKCIINANYVDIQLVYGAKWHVLIRNNTGRTITVQYNGKMCFAGDAKDWKGLGTIKTVVLSNGGSATVRITENWAATSVAISNVYNGTRYISYAYFLGNNPYNMSIFYSQKAA